VAGEVQLVDLTKDFGSGPVVDAVNLEIASGEFFALLGPSGCGKTTTLRMIAGFERPTSGEIYLDGAPMSAVPPHRRTVNTVFQSYALFPHLNVLENVAFGLRRAGLSKSEARARAAETLEMVALDGLARRRPSELSGGQQQRVALARALVLRPLVLLLDEPLSALDAQIRKRLRGELKALQQEVGITFVFVTHDQEEALSMSDRIAVMNGGRVDQVGTPEEVYERPATAFVADFLGVSNLMEVEAVGGDGDGCEVRLGERRLRAAAGDLSCRGAALCCVRPECVEISPRSEGAPPENSLPGMIDRTVYVGSTLQRFVRLAAGPLVQASSANTAGVAHYPQGAPVDVRFPPESLRVLATPAAPQPVAA